MVSIRTKRQTAYSKGDQVLRILEDRGYRSTGPRRTLVRAVTAKDKPFAAEELCRALPQVGRATVYRCLNLLEEAGILCRVLLEDGSLHYQLSYRGHHHHLICTECGQSQDLLGCDIDGMLKDKASQHRFEVEGHRLEVYGRCDKCAALTVSVA